MSTRPVPRCSVQVEEFTLRFGLRSLLAGVVFASIWCTLALSTDFGTPVAVMLPIILALPALATTGIVYGRRDVRAFCIGALFPASLGLGGAVFVVARILERTIDPMAIYYTSAFWNEFSEYAIDPLLVIAIVSWTSSAMIGAATLLFRRLVMSGTNELVSGVGESMN